MYYVSLGGIPGEMASICLDGWVCDSGDTWARGGDLGTLWVHRLASREQNGFRLHAHSPDTKVQ